MAEFCNRTNPVLVKFCNRTNPVGASIILLFAEVFVIKYTLWNLYGEERLIINLQSISHQHYYGFFTTPYQTVSFNRKFTLHANEEIVEGGQTYVRYCFRSFDDKDFPRIVYQSTLSINKIDYQKLIYKLNQLFVDNLHYAFPDINLN
ncbi:hypothetical protein ACXZ1K_16470 [Pedobacter sp. PWIIR3]